ncbi:hypothetical protein [Streptomyces sp. NBC_00620]|uniref:hypothetical protein n=1 Tax=Streptomyces sp. NBC_00620 TaxID=2903666 RepID=UPI00225B97E0|nr:hypothetical protein [Streptomyces sp. NBC_00620]MCX4974201.1 hypothetical protein [Streptomyces sp. NBC_00620]
MHRNRAATAESTAGMHMVAAGAEWDAIKVSQTFALQALQRLAEPGAVLVDPGGAVIYFFVAPGSTAGWEVPQTTALSETAYVVLPPDGRENPPGPYWLIPPSRGRLHTNLDALRAALDVAIGPRPWAPRAEHFG